MAGQLTIDTLKASSGVLATQNGMSGIAKAWVNFAGASGTINGSFNVSSVTRNSTGNYTVTFTTAMPNANYSTVGTTHNYNSNDGAPLIATVSGVSSSPQTTASVRMASTTAWVSGLYSGSNVDCTQFNVAVFA